ncbi:MAG: radical SAM family heme chaperone HemW [Clostridia bacterium]|nr:radical SAM family heme chaperone HemW [Clostridia bacterium]
MKSAYIHIPFCKQKCLYCDFNSFDNQDYLIESYISALKKEISCYNIKELYTLYIGGGTPSYISEKYISDILNLLPKSTETTIEINPGTISFEKLTAYKKAGINRVSIGLQVADDHILKLIGRIHSLKEFEESYSLVRKAGFENVNVDLMFGLPTQTLNSFKETVEYLINLKPEHISSYSLIVHNHIFKNLPSDEEEREMYHYLVTKMKDAHYKHYEISNFAIEGYESKHNLAYWKQKEYYGFGAGASSFIDNKRYTNVRNVKQYISLVNDNKEVRILEETLNEENKLNEYMMLGLRTIEGINIKETNEKFNTNILKRYEKSLKKLNGYRLIEIDDNVKLTSKGLDLANVVWEEFV